MTFAWPLHHATQEGCHFAGLLGGLLGDGILPVLRWSVVTVAPMVPLAALALWLPCMALHCASHHGEVWGSPEHCMGSSGLPCSAQFCASPGPLGGELLGQGREPTCSRLSGTCGWDMC